MNKQNPNDKNPNDLHYFIADEQILPFIHEERHDIAAADAPQDSADQFTIVEIKAPKNQVIVIKAIAPFVCVRTDVGDANLESFEYIPSIQANGFFAWQPFVNDQSKFIIKSNVNAPRIAAGPLLDTDRIVTPGFTHVSDNPTSDIFLRKDFSFSILVRGEKTFTIKMKVLRSGSASGIPNQYKVGNAALAGQKRVDFAGASIYGVTMPEQLYTSIKSKWKMF